MTREQDYYIPPDVTVSTAGKILLSDWPKVLKLDDGRKRRVISFTGMGMPVITYIKQKGPEQHGSTILDFRLGERLIQYSIINAKACGRTEYWQQRNSTINLLRPNRQAVNDFQLGRLRKIWPDGTIRDIDGLIQRGPLFVARKPHRTNEATITETLRFLCPDPTFYDPEQQTVTWTVETFDGLMFYSPAQADHLIFPLNAIFATDVLSGTTAITYTGDWFGYPTIVIEGPISSPKIENVELGIHIQLDYVVAVGETITITTSYGNKTITNQLGVNLIGTRTRNSNMNFYLAPDPTVTDGINTLRVSGANADPDITSITLTYYRRYIGI